MLSTTDSIATDCSLLSLEGEGEGEGEAEGEGLQRVVWVHESGCDGF